MECISRRAHKGIMIFVTGRPTAVRYLQSWLMMWKVCLYRFHSHCTFVHDSACLIPCSLDFLRLPVLSKSFLLPINFSNTNESNWRSFVSLNYLYFCTIYQSIVSLKFSDLCILDIPCFIYLTKKKKFLKSCKFAKQLGVQVSIFAIIFLYV